MRLIRICLALALCLAAVLPPRLNAFAHEHFHAVMEQSHHAHGLHAGGYEADCSGAPAPSEQRQTALHLACIAACACLPARGDEILPDIRPVERARLTPGATTGAPFQGPEGPFRPPRSFS